MEVFDPRPFIGEWRCAASPTTNTRPRVFSVAYLRLTPHVESDSISTGTVSSPMSLCAIETPSSSVSSGVP